MAKIKAYTVSCCDECPFAYIGYEDNYGEPIRGVLKCKNVGKEIGEYEENKNKIATFCPLNDIGS